MTILDLIGEPIEVGDTVSYLASPRYKPSLNVGRVVSIKDHNGTDTVAVEVHSSSREDIPHHLVYLTNFERVTVLS